MSRHDSDLASSGVDDSGAVGSHKARLALAQQGLLDLFKNLAHFLSSEYLNHVLLGDTFGDADNKRHFALDGLQNGSGSSWRRNVDDSSISLGFFHGLDMFEI